MRRITTIIVAITLCACATPNDRRRGLPDINEQSSRPSKDVAICIADKWENTKPFLTFSSPPVNTSMKANGYSIIVMGRNGFGEQNTLVLADIIDYQQGSFVKYYKMGGGGFGDYDEAVRSCL